MCKGNGRGQYQRCGIRSEKAERGHSRQDGGHHLCTLSSFRGRRRPSSCEAQAGTDIVTTQVVCIAFFWGGGGYFGKVGNS